MRLQPLLPVWLVVIVTLGLLALCTLRALKVLHARPHLLRWIRRGVMALLFMLMGLGLSIPGGTSAPGISNLDVVFAVDTTPSMGAVDYNGTSKRLDGIKQDLLALDQQLKGAHVALITFDSQANLVLPFTTVSSTFQEAVNTLTPQVYSYSSGSSIDLPINLITQQLKDSKALNPQRSRFVFYFGDGEQTTDKPVKSFAAIAPYVSGGSVMGYGTAAGAQIIKYTANGYAQPSASSNDAYILTPNDAGTKLVPAVSKMNPDNLKAMAKQMGIQYIDRDKGGPINDVLQSTKITYTIDNTKHINRYLNLYWLFALPFSGLLFWEWKDIILKLLALQEYHLHLRLLGDKHGK